MSIDYSFIDKVEEEYSNGEPSFIEEYERERVSPGYKAEDVATQLGVGGARGLGAYGNILDLLHAQTKDRLFPGQKALAQAEFDAPESLLPFLQEDDVLPHYSRLPSGKEIEDLLQHLGVDTEPYTEAGKTGRRIGEGAGSAAAMGPLKELIAAGALGGAVGGLTEELSGSPLAGDLAEIATNITALMRRGLPSIGGKRGERIAALESLGFSPSEVTLLSQGRGKLNFLGKLASKDSKMEKLFSNIFKRADNLYDGLREASKDFGYLTGEKAENFLDSLVKVFGDLTPGQQEVVQGIVSKFQQQPFTFKSMMDFIHDVGDKLKNTKGHKRAAFKITQPVREAMKELSPEAAEVFEDLQKAYGSAKKIGQKLKISTLDNLMEAAELYEGAKGLIEAKPSFLLKAIGLVGTRKLAREFLINPDLQGIMLRITKAANEGKMLLAERLARKLPQYLSKEEEE